MLGRVKMRLGWMVGAVVAGLAASSALATPPPIVVLQSGANPATGAQSPLLINSGTNSGNAANHGNFSLTSSTNVLLVQGSNASYMPSYVNGIDSSATGDASDFLQVSGFTSGDVEIYALKLDYNGTYLDPIANATLLGHIITDINNDNAAGGGSIASTIPAMLQSDFPGYDVALTIPSGFITGSLTPGSPVEYDFGFNFANLIDPTNVPGTVTVTDIGVIPEPASAALLGVLVIPALASRRRSVAI